MERKLKDRMREESRYPEALKEQLWSQIEANLDTESTVPPRSKQNHSQRRGRMMKRVKISTGIAAVVVAVVVFFSLPMGTAMMKDVKNWFAPEKKIEISIEGEKEETNQKLHQGEAKKESSEYVIYYDQDRYKLVSGQYEDVITTKEPLPDRYPDVSLTIAQYPEAKPADMIAELEKEIRRQLV